MPIRLARYSDIPEMSTVLAASFGPDKLFQVMFPNQKQYPEDFVDAFRTRLRESWWDYSRVLMVSYTTIASNNNTAPPSETNNAVTEAEVITGMAEWERVGTGWEKVWNAWGRWDPRHLIKHFIRTFHLIRRTLSPNRAAVRPTPQDPQPLTWDNFGPTIGPFTAQYFSHPPWRRNHWDLNILAVHPLHQNQGYGRALATWGVARSSAEGVPAAVVGAEGKENFYRSCGFRLLAGWASQATDKDGNENPLAKRGVGGGAILWSAVKEDRADDG